MATDRHKTILEGHECKAIERRIALVQGPLPLTESEVALGQIIDMILNSNTPFQENSSGELVYDRFNICGILATKPKFDFVHVTPENLDKYSKHLQGAEFKPDITNPATYIARETKAGISPAALHVAEKMAINIYTKKYYRMINTFLRNLGMHSSREFSQLSAEQFQLRIKDILLATVIASSGLKKIEAPKNQKLFRIDRALPDAVIRKRSSHHSSSEISYETGFFSTSADEDNIINTEDNGVYTLVIPNEIAKPVSAYSSVPNEKEFLFPPGTRFLTLHYHQEGNRHYFINKPVRALAALKNPDEQKQSALVQRGVFSKSIVITTGIMLGLGLLAYAASSSATPSNKMVPQNKN